MSRITGEKIIEINELFYKLKVKTHVARAMGISPSTVAKYVIEGYIPVDKRENESFDIEVPEVPMELFKETENWGDLCYLSEDEKTELEKLRTEINF